MALDISAIGSHKVISIPSGESVELKSLWQEQNAVIIFFRRWGCMFCRLWAKELCEIAPVLKKNNIRLVGVGVEEVGAKTFLDGKFFDGELYYVEDRSTYDKLGFKRFNHASIITSLFWKQSREAISKGRSMGLHNDLIGDGLQNGGALILNSGGNVLLHYISLTPTEHLDNLDIAKVLHSYLSRQYSKLNNNYDFPPITTKHLSTNLAVINAKYIHSTVRCLGGDLKGDWVQTGGLLLVEKGGKLIRHFTQTGPSDHLSNNDILKLFNLENEYNAAIMANKERENVECDTEPSP